MEIAEAQAELSRGEQIAPAELLKLEFVSKSKGT